MFKMCQYEKVENGDEIYSKIVSFDEEFNRIVGIVLSEKRKNKGYSLAKLSELINHKVSRQTLQKYEKNITHIRHGTFNKVCEALGEKPQDVSEEISIRYLKYINNKSSGNQI